MAKIFKTLILIITILVAGCAHQMPKESPNRTKAELHERYPIVGISFTEFESLLNDIKEQIPSNTAILSIGLSNHSNVAHVITGRIDGPLSGGGLTLVFEKIENKWKLVQQSVWIS